MKVRYTRTAISEVDEIFSYIWERNPRSAARVIEAVARAVSRIAQFPESAPSADEPGVRVAVVGRLPYLVFYSVENEEMAIVHVRHAARLRPWE